VKRKSLIEDALEGAVIENEAGKEKQTEKSRKG
jgi:hypothetical protein